MVKDSGQDRNIDTLVRSAVFDANELARERNRQNIRKIASESGIYPASIQGLYEAAGKGLYSHITVPAINIRGITYYVARAVFRAALKLKAGAFTFEIARSEMGYTRQNPAEYAACVLAAAVREHFRGPVFIQGDHFQVNRRKYGAEPEIEMKALRELIQEAVSAGFLNIDIDASTLVDIEKPALEEQQEKNYQVTAELSRFIRSIEPEGVTISIGGEIGEIGKGNSTAGDLRAFMSGYADSIGKNHKGISKISVQTGTSHGGVVLPDGSIAEVKLDFKTLEELSRIARTEFGLGGAVQHGASTLPDEAFDMFPKVGTLEVHLATGFQNLIYDSPHFPPQLRDRVYEHLLANYSNEKKQGESEEQFLYKTRKKAFGDFKRDMWELPEENLGEIMEMLEKRFVLLFQRLNIANTSELVHKYVVSPPPQT